MCIIIKLLYSQILIKIGSKIPDWRLVNKHITKEGRLAKEDFVVIIQETTELLSNSNSYHYLENEPNLLEMDEPVVIVGDIHGQYYDLCHLIEKAGDPDGTNYLFMGDYVDRGIFSVE